jgi:hypothetical protein
VGSLDGQRICVPTTILRVRTDGPLAACSITPRTLPLFHVFQCVKSSEFGGNLSRVSFSSPSWFLSAGRRDTNTKTCPAPGYHDVKTVYIDVRRPPRRKLPTFSLGKTRSTACSIAHRSLAPLCSLIVLRHVSRTDTTATQVLSVSRISHYVHETNFLRFAHLTDFQVGIRIVLANINLIHTLPATMRDALLRPFSST